MLFISFFFEGRGSRGAALLLCPISLFMCCSFGFVCWHGRDCCWCWCSLLYVCLGFELFSPPLRHTHTHYTLSPSLPSPVSDRSIVFFSFIPRLHHKQTSHWPPPLPPTTIHGALSSRLCSSFAFGETFLPSCLHKPSSPIAPLTPLCIIISVPSFFSIEFYFS